MVNPVTSVRVELPAWVTSAVDWNRRYSSDEEKMALAITLSSQNVQQETGGPFAAAIFDSATGGLLGVGVNRVVSAHNSTFHGEMAAIMMAQKKEGVFSLAAKGFRRELFTSCEPCAMCLGAILGSGVTRLICAATGQDARAIGFDEGPVFPESYVYLQSSGIEVTRGFLREKAQAVLGEYSRRGGIIYSGLPQH